MEKAGKSVSYYLILVGLVILVSSLVFMFYYFEFVLSSEYQTVSVVAKVQGITSCLRFKILNASYDYKTCEGSVLNSQFPSYSQVVSQILAKEIATPIGFFTPIIVGIILIVIGYVLKRKLFH